MTAQPADAVVLHDLAILLERGGGESYGWVPNRLRTIADRLGALDAELQAETVMRVQFEKRGGHYHCRVFTTKAAGLTFAKNGDLVFDEREWPDVPLLLRGKFIEETTAGWPVGGD